jgi:hypothetical protein
MALRRDHLVGRLTCPLRPELLRTQRPLDQPLASRCSCLAGGVGDDCQ